MADFFDYHVMLDGSRRVLIIDLLPEKSCTFDCVYCPMERTKFKTDIQMSFGDPGFAGISAEISRKIRETKPDFVYIESKGESMLVSFISETIDYIHSEGLPVRLLTNGYILNEPLYRRIAEQCEEVVAELSCTSEEQFQRLSRPMEGMTLAKYILNMAQFGKWYRSGGDKNRRFILDIIALRGHNDDDASIARLKAFISLIEPDQVQVIQVTDSAKFMNAFGLTTTQLNDMAARLSR